MSDLIKIAFVPSADQKYLDSIRSYFNTIRENAIPEFSEQKPIKTENGYVVPWNQATAIMFDQLRVMKRLQCGQ